MVSRFTSWLLHITPLCLLVLSLNINSSELVPGDIEPGTSDFDSFSFTVGSTAFYRMDGADGSTFYSYIGAGATKASNNYAVAYIQRGGKQFMPLAPSH